MRACSGWAIDQLLPVNLGIAPPRALANKEREVGINIDELSCDDEIESAVHEDGASGVQE